MKTVADLKKFLSGLPDDHQVWATGGSIYASPFNSRDKFVVFDDTFPERDLEALRREMQRVAAADFDCPV